MIKNLQSDGIEILLAGDFNEYDITKGTLKALSAQGLVHLNKEQPQASYSRGKTCIDHMFISPNTLQRITGVKYVQYPEEFDTDHKPMEIILSIEKYKSSIQPSATTHTRRLFSKDWNSVQTYVSQRIKRYHHYKIQEKLTEIEYLLGKETRIENESLKSQVYQMVNELDQQHTRICLEAEKILAKRKGVYKTAEVKIVLEELAHIRYEIRKSKQKNDTQ